MYVSLCHSYLLLYLAGLEVVRDSIPSSDISESTMYGYGLFSGGGSRLGFLYTYIHLPEITCICKIHNSIFL